MACLIVQRDGMPNRVFPLRNDLIHIGRGDEADLRLSRSTVSRVHARVRHVPDGWELSDMESQNGTFVNARRTSRHVLGAGDTVQLGEYTLIYVHEEVKGASFEGRPIEDLPLYQAPLGLRATTTMMMDASLRPSLHASEVLSERARLQGDGSRWPLGIRTRCFGNGWDIPVDGVGPLRTKLAEIVWTGENHELVRVSRAARVEVNDRAARRVVLQPGDRICIASSAWTYTVGRRG